MATTTAPGPQNDGVPYIGSRISLISKKDIRYEGILYNINTKDSTVALQTVRSYGTEDRVAAGADHVAPSASTYEYVIFNGADIKDLHVCEAAKVVLPDDPAIVNSMNSAPPAPAAIAPPASPAPAPVPQQQQQPVARPSPQPSTNTNTNNRTIPGMGGHLLHRKARGVQDEKVPKSTTSEFDFVSGLGGFNKEVEFSKLTLSEGQSGASYQKSSFFDNISCDALDRLDGRTGRIRASEERALNTETFGAVGLNNRRHRRGGRGRGRGRGGRGGGGEGGRGRGRGRGRRGRSRQHYGNGNLPPNNSSSDQK